MHLAPAPFAIGTPPTRRGGRKRTFDYNKAVQLRRAGMTFGEIGEALGASSQSVRKAVLRIDPTLGRIGLVNERRGGQRNPDRRAIIIEKRKAGQTYQKIGDQVGISGERVRQILEVDAPELCYRQNKHNHPKPPASCARCGELYAPSRSGTEFCSMRCAALSSRGASDRERKMALCIWRRLHGVPIQAIELEIDHHWQTVRRWVEEELDRTNAPECVRKCCFPGHGAHALNAKHRAILAAVPPEIRERYRPESGA